MAKSSKAKEEKARRKPKGTIKSTNQKSSKRKAEVKKAMKMMKSPKQIMKAAVPKQKKASGKKDVRPKAMKAILKAMKSTAMKSAKEAAAKSAAKAAAKCTAKGAAKSAAATIARRVRAQAKSSLKQPKACKTKLCSFWLEGRCRRGEECDFAHSAEEQLANCRQVPCRFHVGGVYPASCKFAHCEREGRIQVPEDLALDFEGIVDSINRSMADVQLAKASSSDEAKQQKTLLCKFWLKDKCLRPDCSFAHSPEEQQRACKMIRCRFDMEGFCKQGTACRYAHENVDSADATQEDQAGLSVLPPPGLDAPQEPPEPHESSARSRASDDSTKPLKTLLCKFWMRGKCLRQDCAFAHGLEEQQLACESIRCRFDREGFCKLGEACWYAHEEPYTPRRPARLFCDLTPGPVLRAPPGLELPSDPKSDRAWDMELLPY